MPPFRSPALSAFADALCEPTPFAQVLIARDQAGFELRHVDDAETAAQLLKPVALDQLRALAQTSQAGAFRPLKSAPNLRTGWRTRLRDEGELGLALDLLYPGAITDWFARNEAGAITSYRRHAERQTGMYRITSHLDAATSAPVIAACCDRQFCLKQRRWTYDATAADPAGEWDLPCLEPCALLMEFARKAVRIAQESPVEIRLSASELETLLAALSESPAAETAREADFADDRNLRRRKLLEHRLQSARDEIREAPEQ